jgi:hypothetical protein
MFAEEEWTGWSSKHRCYQKSRHFPIPKKGGFALEKLNEEHAPS